MGSIAQEMGHDLTIMYFIDKVLKPKKNREDFFVIHPAMGPKRDIHYWNPEHNEYTSGWNTSGDQKFIPDYLFRRDLSPEELQKLKEESKYWNEQWYKTLSRKLNEDLKDFTDRLCSRLEETIKEKFPDFFDRGGKFPDFIGVRERKITSIGEVKFEYLPKRALSELLAYSYLAKQEKVPFYLIFPKKGYTKTDFNWLAKNLPKEIVEFYLFEGAEPKPLIVPNYRDIKFSKWEPK